MALKDFPVTENVAYQDIALKSEDIEEGYENPADIVCKPSEKCATDDETVYSTIMCTAMSPDSDYMNIGAAKINP